MTHSAFVLLPPLVVLILAVWKRNVIASLSIGIIVASLISTKFR